MIEITGAQVRMARAALRWPMGELGLDVSTIQATEGVDGVPSISGSVPQTLEDRQAKRAESSAAIRRALESAGVTFLRADSRDAGLQCKTDEAEPGSFDCRTWIGAQQQRK